MALSPGAKGSSFLDADLSPLVLRLRVSGGVPLFLAHSHDLRKDTVSLLQPQFQNFNRWDQPH